MPLHEFNKKQVLSSKLLIFILCKDKNLPEMAAVCFQPQETWTTQDSKNGPWTFSGEWMAYEDLDKNDLNNQNTW
jgi:hypothetical protein